MRQSYVAARHGADGGRRRAARARPSVRSAASNARVDSYSRLCQIALVRYGLWRYTEYSYVSIDEHGDHRNLRFRHV